MKRPIFPFLLVAILVLGAAWAATPQKWTFRSYDEFLRGRFDGVSLTAEGVLSLAPREDKIDGPTEEFYLSFLVTLDGTTFVGTGHSGRIFRLGKDGKGELYYQAQEMDVTSLAVDPRGALYAGTSPNGKIYKITGKSQGAVFFDPAEKYIWDMMKKRPRSRHRVVYCASRSNGAFDVAIKNPAKPFSLAGFLFVVDSRLRGNDNLNRINKATQFI